MLFNDTRKLSINVSKELDFYASKFKKYDDIIFEQFTIREYIELLKKSQETDLSLNVINEILSVELSETFIESLIFSLNNQKGSLEFLMNYIREESKIQS